jgi:hypothetical protein
MQYNYLRKIQNSQPPKFDFGHLAGDVGGFGGGADGGIE